MTYLMHPEPMQPGQARLMGILHEWNAARYREELREFSTEYQRDVPLNDMPVRPGPNARRPTLRNNSMADFETTHFEKMGDSALENGVVNVSGARSRYMCYLPRDAKGAGVGGTTATPDMTDDSTPGTGTKGNRGSVLQPAGYSALESATHRISTVLSGGQAEAPARSRVLRGPYRRNAAVAALADHPGPVIVDDDSWQDDSWQR